MGLLRLVAAGLLLLGALHAERPPESFALFLDLARAGETIVAVGEQGLALRSTDEGRTWARGTTQTSATLTAVAFIDAQRGWACGHEGTLLETKDAGITWTTRMDVLPADASPLVLRAAGQRLIVAGAFGLVVTSLDGGAHWQRQEEPEGGPHVYSVFNYEGGWLLAGEMGFLGILPNSSPVETHSFGAPSLHGLLPLRDGATLAFGIRGHLYRRETEALEWKQVTVGSTQLIACGVELPDQRVLLAGQSGLWLLSRDGGRTFSRAQRPEGLAGIAALLATHDSYVLCAGEKGIARIAIPLEETP
ncbi:WD40/YVTN/BNR-like repeat-containing protein [Nibricoccus sp. IMCC34717]|uniref:WD40/YVTN/BNR-like repeat-containing protein n=1 Tax=Nibricoccus sp. IMCC34717 TaxID=3034021 RepID=UPI00384E7650